MTLVVLCTIGKLNNIILLTACISGQDVQNPEMYSYLANSLVIIVI